MSVTPDNRNKQVITGAAVLMAIALIVAATVVSNKNDAVLTEFSAAASDTPTASDKPSSTTASASTYKDGTYTASAHYQSPGGAEGVTVELTLKNGVVTDSTVSNEASQAEAREYHRMFQSGYKSQVVGKSIDSINLNRVSGSSLTSEGFNSALIKIRQQAQA